MSIFSIQLNRKYLNKKDKEIDRFAIYTKNNKIFYFSFLIKDKNKDYNDLYYPSEESYSPQMTSEEWFHGGKIIPQKVHNNTNKHNENSKKDLINQFQNNNNTQTNIQKKSSEKFLDNVQNKLNKNKEQNDIEILKRTIEELKNKNQLLENEKNKII